MSGVDDTEVLRLLVSEQSSRAPRPGRVRLADRAEVTLDT
jgi:hypothetical protein